MSSKVVLIAGASGYIGKALIEHLSVSRPELKIIALSRSARDSRHPNVSWRACDLFSLKQLEAAIPESIDAALYLVHSMAPTAQLDQGSFQDYDLILSDNFARFAKRKGVQQIVYLGGLIPQGQDVSEHLQSRREMEEVFEEHEVPLTVFRAGLVLGVEGSSSQILFRLVKRLPIMLCPAWTQTLTSPVDLATVTRAFEKVILNSEAYNQTYDLAGCEPLPYIEMMKVTAQKMGLTRRFWFVPYFTPTLSRFWVSLITGFPKELVFPLVESLEHPMVARESHLLFPTATRSTFSELMDRVGKISIQPGNSSRAGPSNHIVRSVQRFPLPEGRAANWVAYRYLHWLPKFFRPFIKVLIDGELANFCFLHPSLSLLRLRLSKERSTPDRQLFYIEGGLLNARKSHGRFEFREVLRKKHILAAIHDFKPALPWFVYQYTQAIIHLWVMKSFGRYLGRLKT